MYTKLNILFHMFLWSAFFTMWVSRVPDFNFILAVKAFLTFLLMFLSVAGLFAVGAWLNKKSKEGTLENGNE